MFISHFNRYFEKHAKITYFVLLLIIIATFVIFVTPGDVMGGPGRISDFGEMYGKTLTIEKMEKEMNRALLSIWLEYPHTFGTDVFRDKRELFQYALVRMRLLHAADEMDMDSVSDNEVRTFIHNCTAFQKDGKFDTNAFNNFMEYCRSSMGMYPADFDDVVAECIATRNVQNHVRAQVTVSEAEIDADIADFTLQCATVAINHSAYLPTDAEVRDFFNTRKADLPNLLPATKNASVALFKFDAVKAMAAKNKELAAAITPTEAEISAMFKSNADTSYKGKTLDQVKVAITAELTSRKIRTAARDIAGKLIAEASKKEIAPAERIKLFDTAARKAGAAVSASGLISSENAISGMKGDQVSLATAIRNCKEIGDISDVVQGNDYVAVVCITEKRATTPPAQLPEGEDARNDSVYRIISDAIVRERALAFFNEKVKAPYEAYMTKLDAIKADKSLDENTRNSMMFEAGTGLDGELIMPFHIQETRDFVLVSFENDAYAGKITAANMEDAQKAYESRKEEFQTPLMKTAYIRIQTAGLEGDELKAKNDKVAQAEKRIKAGEDFLKVAGELSDMSVHTDNSTYPISVYPDAIKNVLANLKAGEVSSVIDSDGYKQIFKVLERQEGKSFDDVKNDLVKELNAERMARMAAEDSAAFAAKVSDEYWKDTEKADIAAIMKKIAAAYPLAKVTTASKVSPQDRSSYDYNVLFKVFNAEKASPLTGSINANGASYNAALLSVTPGRLSDPAADASVYQVKLLPAYSNAINSQDARQRADAEVKRIREALAAKPGDLAAAAGTLKFQAMPAFSVGDVTASAQNVQDIQKKFNITLSSLTASLKNITAPGVVLEPQLSSMSLPYGMNQNIALGYQVLYVSERSVPVMEAAKRDEIRARLLIAKQNEAMSNFMTQLEADSNTLLRPDTSYTSGL